MINYRVGIITYPKIEEGKGRFLQAYALFTAVKELGYKPEILNYYPEDWTANKTITDKIKNFMRNPNIWGYIKTIRHKVSEKRNKKSIEVSTNKYLDFIRNNIIYDYSHIITKEELQKVSFDAWICGSDQIWNSHFSVGTDSAYYLQFAPKKSRISYAASMGTLDINNNYINQQKEWISEIPHISVRENGTKKMLEERFGIDSEHVCDPTFLMSRDWWDAFGSKRIISEPYLLLFLFDANPLPREKAEEIAEERKLKIVCISDEYNDSKKYTIPFGIGPEDFVSLFKYADYVCTQSFHGMVLSVIFNRQFLVFDRNGKGEVSGLLLRIQDLLSQLSLETRIINNSNEVEKISEIDFRESNAKIEENRQKGLDFLKKSIEQAMNDEKI